MRLILAFCLALAVPWAALASGAGAAHCGAGAHGAAAQAAPDVHLAHAGAEAAHAGAMHADPPADGAGCDCDCGCACVGSHCVSTHTVVLARGAALAGPARGVAAWRHDSVPSDPLDPHHRSILRPPIVG